MARSTSSVGTNREVKVRPIGIVVFDGVEIIDVTGPMEVFAFANHFLQRSGITKENVYPTKLLAKKPGLVTTSCGLQINADSAYGDIKDGIDILMIPGAIDVKNILSDASLQDWMRTLSPRPNRFVSVCTGAFLLAETGFLNGRLATSHWAYCDQLAADYPSVTVEPDRIFVRDDFVSTSGGVTAGIDLALSIVEEDWGRELALNVARFLVVFLKRPGGQSQFSGYLVSEATNHPDLRKLQVWVMENPAENLSIEVLAERMATSPRNFSRVFLTETGMTPAKFVEKARIDAARHYLGETDLLIETVASKSGFGDPERMRRAFIRHLGVNPQDYRAWFSRNNPPPIPFLTNFDPSAIIAPSDQPPVSGK
ncbi:MAG: GlxA family transcriptional regulator [Candidatus Methylumidiphilus alinenensis]|uniref:GlxA family transcriptional regulator n=1 Tax=Candidatus Methylumidiphilus alinenensis TaxID=2202197 RepID=A0A2W4RB83_9GAMM|nr:MAG: GlxA family transcriptional regulator [Candidatus Methylumidiphilus alinenensis]